MLDIRTIHGLIIDLFDHAGSADSIDNCLFDMMKATVGHPDYSEPLENTNVAGLYRTLSKFLKELEKMVNDSKNGDYTIRLSQN